MKPLEELRGLYESELAPVFAEIKAALAVAKKRAFLFFPIPLLVLFPVLMIFVSDWIPLLGISFIGATGIAVFYYQMCRRKQTIRFKDVVTRKILKVVTPEISYDREKYVSKQQFQKSGIYRQSIDRYSGEDCFFGKYEGVDLMFSEIHAEERRTSTDSKGRTTTHYVTIFKGVFFIADFNKDFRTSTFVIPSRGWQWLKKLGAPRNTKLITLESPEFEKMFAVYAQDAIEARYILTPNIMERMIAIQRRFPGDVAFAFHESSVYIAIPSNTDFFEIPRTLDFSGITSLYNELALFFNLVHEMNLTLRIWTKQ
jgi:hypothetical protein